MPKNKKHNQLQELQSCIYTIEAHLKLFTMNINGRMTIIKLNSGGLWIHSPIRLTDEVKDQVLALNAPIEHIVAPNHFHHLFLNDWLSIAPNAKLWIPRGLELKRKDLQDFFFLDQQAPWFSEIEYLLIDGMPKVNEYLFWHKQSKTLICTDFLFYIPKPAGGLTKIYAYINQCKDKPSPTKLFLSMVNDKKAFKNSWLKVLNWDIDRISTCHNQIYTCVGNGQNCITDAYDFLRLTSSNDH